MKHPQLVFRPSEVSDWLEEQLEARGIDAIAYTRYILSLFDDSDPTDVLGPDHDHFTALKSTAKEHKKHNNNNNHVSRKHFRCLHDWRDYIHGEADQLKRSIAIQCLMSASDQQSGIESLVDELCAKLRQVNANQSAAAQSPIATNPIANNRHTSPRDLAQKYYAAFPPLSTAGSGIVCLSLMPEPGSPRRTADHRRPFNRTIEKAHAHCEHTKPRGGNPRKHNYLNRNRNDLLHARTPSTKAAPTCTNEMADLFMLNNARNRYGSERQGSEQSNRADQLLGNDYDDLPVGILELLDSPTPPDTVEMMNLANIRNTGNQFIHAGTNITSSIWSIDAAMDGGAPFTEPADHVLGTQFKSLTMDGDMEKIWSKPELENATNVFYEKCGHLPYLRSDINEFAQHFWSAGNKFEKWSEEPDFLDTTTTSSSTTTTTTKHSLLQLNHTDESSFIEVVPKQSDYVHVTTVRNAPAHKQNVDDRPQECLLTSMASHFRPINALRGHADQHRQYADGTTFPIASHWDKPKYKRSHSGSLFVEVDYGAPKRLFEYANKKHVSANFALRFMVRQNDKGCQTDEEMEEDAHEVPCKKRVLSDAEDVYFPGDEKSLLDDDQDVVCTCAKDAKELGDACAVHPPRSDSITSEIIWKNDVMAGNCSCKTWESNWVNEEGPRYAAWELDKTEAKRIWSGGGGGSRVGGGCAACSALHASPNYQKSKLREDITQDGEQLLSDLSCLQKCYMDSEISYDIAELLAGNTERKRRHSPHASDLTSTKASSWSITSHLKPDRLVQMASVPVLHSLTL